MVTKEEVEKAKSEWKAAYDAAYDDATEAAYTAANVDVEEAEAIAWEAWDKYIELKRKYRNGN